MKKRFFMFAVLGLSFAALSTLSACNTVDGFGADVEHTGKTIQNTF